MFLFWGEGMAEVKEVKEELIYTSIVYKVIWSRRSIRVKGSGFHWPNTIIKYLLLIFY